MRTRPVILVLAISAVAGLTSCRLSPDAWLDAYRQARCDSARVAAQVGRAFHEAAEPLYIQNERLELAAKSASAPYEKRIESFRTQIAERQRDYLTRIRPLMRAQEKAYRDKTGEAGPLDQKIYEMGLAHEQHLAPLQSEIERLKTAMQQDAELVRLHTKQELLGQQIDSLRRRVEQQYAVERSAVVAELERLLYQQWSLVEQMTPEELREFERRQQAIERSLPCLDADPGTLVSSSPEPD